MMGAPAPPVPRRSNRLWRIGAFLLVAALALGLRVRAVQRLPIDYDEDDYLTAAQRYAAALRLGDWHFVVNYDYNFEHPPLTKLAYAAALLPLPDAPAAAEHSSSDPPAASLPEPQFRLARYVAAAFGTLEAMALAGLNPLAGLFLAIQTWQIKYTSQIMLEPLPALCSALAVVCYWKARGSGGGARSSWLALSAITMGLTAASKYVYCIAGLAVAADWLWASFPTGLAGRSGRLKAIARWLAPLIAWGLLAVAVFILFDPRLWVDPLGRLRQSLLFHLDYAQSQHVEEAGYPIWQPFVWLSGSVPWHPGVFVVSLDLYISLLAILGFRRLWKRQRVFALWLLIALAFLTWWTTKWPQYLLILTAPLSLAAAQGFSASIWEPLTGWLRRRRDATRAAARHRPRQMDETSVSRWKDVRRAFPWLLPGTMALLALAIYPLVYQGAMSLTDFNATSIRDGIQGGVWRAVWQGLTGQVRPVPVDLFVSSAATFARQVHFTGPSVLVQLLGGLGADVLFFNVLWVVLTLSLQAALGIGLALILNRRGLRLAGLWRSVLLLPWAIPEFVGAMFWLRLFEPDYGWIPEGMPHDIPLPSFFADKNFALFVLAIAATWYGFPLIMLAASAALKSIPLEVYDAAALDGAAGWRQLQYITWPLLLPLVVPALIIRSIFSFNQFYLFYVMRPPFPITTWASVSFFFFNAIGPSGGQFAVSAAINIFTVLVLIGLLLVFNRWTRASEGVTYA